jgi:signal transduction histidine kinase
VEVIPVSSSGKRTTIERKENQSHEVRMMRDQIKQHKMLLELGQIITSEMNLDSLPQVIIEQTNQFMNTERCSVFMFDAENDQLWSLVSTDLEKNEIRFATSHGVMGSVFQNKTPLIINDPYSSPLFFPDVDKQTGFKTRNILCIPLINREKECIGTLQTLNKRTGDFTEEDQELLTAASHYITIALENAKLYEDLKVLDKAKERVINHLSHELRTPLAIIASVFTRIHDLSMETHVTGLERALARGQRNLERLTDLQVKIDDILNQRLTEDKEKILHIIESAADLAWDLSGTDNGQLADMLEIVSDHLESFFSREEVHGEEIRIGEFLQDVYDRTLSSIGERELNILRKFDRDLCLFMSRNVLEKISVGLLKNAIENTPDEGTIEIIAKVENDEIQLVFHDYGVGITPLNQQMIFGGFFHTQDTDLYSSKRPYEFRAGGSGSDLLRIQCFSERYGFSVEFQSTRCKFIPNDTDLCPGKISQCKFITKQSECLASGESTFSVKFPADRFRKPSKA